MIIKELELKNIRSYRKAKVELPMGRTLFEGDIGSGKSTILMAVEFALFGLGSESGASLLRLGEQEGEVRLRFEAEGREYEVGRRLQRKGGSVQQRDGWVETPEEKLELSPGEVKEKVLEVLRFNEAPDPKAQSTIFRYAVYTPQEEMKEVLAMSPDLRLQTLRRAFRVEDYKTAAENAQEVARELRGEVRELEGAGRGLERLKEEASELREESGELKRAHQELEKQESGAEREVARLKGEREKLRVDMVSYEKARTEERLLERSVSERREGLEGLEEELEGLRERAGELREVEVPKGPPESLTILELKAEERKAQAEVKKLAALEATMEEKLRDYGTIMESGVCPVCDTKIAEHDFGKRTEAKEAERRHVRKLLGEAEGKLEDARLAREKAEEERQARARAADAEKERKTVDSESHRVEGARKKILAKLKEEEARLAELVKMTTELQASVAKVEAMEESLEGAEESLRKTRDSISTGREKLRGLGVRVARLKEEVEAKEKARTRRDSLAEAELWLTGYFVPTVQLIERSVLATINQDFGALFQKWFAMLVEDAEKDVRVDDDFTPLVTQEGYEQDVRYLSGGERTSVALGYRLALNAMAQRALGGAASDLLILDEPTDGFSREQLGNVREVLDDLGAPQVIVVSHDKELESYADQILRVRKAGGVSVVETPAR